MLLFLLQEEAREQIQQLEAQEEAELEMEEEAANELAAEQEIYAAERELSNLQNQGALFKKPSTIKYAILLILAVVADIVDLVEFTGVGLVIAVIASAVAWILLISIAWLTSAKLKQAQEYIKNLPEALARVQTRIAQATRLSLKAARMGRKYGVAKKATRAIPRLLVKARKFAGKNPFLRILVLGAVDIIPVIDLLPFNVLGVILAYHIEKKTLKEAREAASSLN